MREKNWKQLPHLLLWLILPLLVAFLMSRHLWSGDVLFHSDVARDQLILQEMLDQKKITLIGPRSSMPGMFHGPLWYYVTIIPFILFRGNPVAMGWFWWFLGLITGGIFAFFCYRSTKSYWVTSLATLLYYLLELSAAVGPTNTYFASLLAFLPFVFWLEWWKDSKWFWAALAWLSMGLLVQFQMAFIVPIAVAWFPVFLFRIFQKKLFKQFLTVFAFLPPLVTFLLFDLRHDWLQARALLSFVTEGDASGHFDFWPRFFERLQTMLKNGLSLFALPAWLNGLFLLGVTIFGWRGKKDRPMLAIAWYWYFSWWLLSVFFSGAIWVFYYFPFLTIFLLVVAQILSRRTFGKILFSFLAIFAVIKGWGNFQYSPQRFDSSSWRLLSQISKDALAEEDIGYFLYSQDQMAYPLKYAFLYYQRKERKSAQAFTKVEKTVLVESADDPNNPWSTAKDWKLNKIRIDQEPDEVKSYPFGYTVERYSLDEETIARGVDPNLVTGLELR